jgi:hypothetical protein
MKNIRETIPYAEGLRAGNEMSKRIDQTTYRTLLNAIQIKQELTKHFEDNFAYDEETYDYTYAYNLGILHGLRKAEQDAATGQHPLS